MKKYYTIDHRILFLFGFLFYFLTPYVVGRFNLFAEYPGMQLFQGYFKEIPPNKLTYYWIITLSWLPAFYLGHFSFKLAKPYKKALRPFPANFVSEHISLIAGLLSALLFVFIIVGRNSIFGGYELYDTGVRGKFSTLLIVFNFFLLYQLLSEKSRSVILIGGTTLTALLLLSMGGRMYVVQTFIVLLVYKTSFAPNRWKISQIIVVLGAAFIVGSAVGLWRMKSSFNLSGATYSLFAEPVFTWFSTSTFLSRNEIPLINFPANFLSSFLNLLPNSIFNIKQYVISIKQMGYQYKNPLGADSVWTTFIVNFGAFGSFFFIYLTGFLLNFLRHFSEDKRFWAAYYICICGMIPFQLFRDGFFIINKQLFSNLLLFPALIILLLKLIGYFNMANHPTVTGSYSPPVQKPS